MTVPGSEPEPRSPLEQIDTTVSIEELRAIRGWPKGLAVKSGGEVMLALHADQDDILRLSILADNVGTVLQFPVTSANLNGGANDTHDGNTFPPRSQGSDYRGPILFAIQTRPVEGSEPVKQVAVFSEKSSLRVAMRTIDGGSWEPRFKLEFARGTRFIGIGTTYPH
jgi:hypothetical protein